ncbi:MAG: glutaredoxin 3 [Rhodospirillales bacterium]|jgi:glutaredoxin 3|nr:glutaredoxin 3 [Rhodospirillales bacterium]HJO72851.1 glutaredoxin 3 [Rhodospirillales bacterium]|tara:strand:- start:49 stop:330 length:282 start_codon:yes stop_codon:yes gene_type:complete
MPEIEIYATPFCPFCYRAKALLADKSAAFTEIDVMVEPVRRSEMMDRAGGGYTVPQVFVDDARIGDCNELYALEYAGKLDVLLGLGRGEEEGK